jgi:hypothetical protein
VQSAVKGERSFVMEGSSIGQTETGSATKTRRHEEFKKNFAFMNGLSGFL